MHRQPQSTQAVLDQETDNPTGCVVLGSRSDKVGGHLFGRLATKLFQVWLIEELVHPTNGFFVSRHPVVFAVVRVERIDEVLQYAGPWKKHAWHVIGIKKNPDFLRKFPALP